MSKPRVVAARAPRGRNELEDHPDQPSEQDFDTSPSGDETVERELITPLRKGDFARATTGAWSLVKRWLAAENGEAAKGVPTEGLTALNRVAAMVYLTGDPGQAHQLWERVVTLCRRQPDSAPLEQAAAFHGIGTVLHKEGNLSGADRLLRKAWQVRKKLLGADSADSAASLNRLALVRREVGDLEEAEAFLRESLEIRRKVLGEEHPDYAISLNNLGALLMARGKSDEAKGLIERAIEVRREVLGEEHPDVASSLSNLAVLCQSTGEWKRALVLHREALEIRRTALGESHPHYITNLNTLTELLLSRGDLAAALPLLDQTLQRARDGLAEAIAEQDALFGQEAGSNGPTRPSAPIQPISTAPEREGPSIDMPSPFRGKRSMSATIDELSRRIQALGSEFKALSEPLAGAVTALKEPGAPLANDLLQRLLVGRDEFVALRDALNERGEKAGVGPVDCELSSLSGLGRYLVRIETEHRRVEQTRKAALALLDRALGLTHVDQPEFAPLKACQEGHGAERSKLAKATGAQLEELAKPLTRDDHPLMSLFALVAGPDALDDDAWANAYEVVSQTYGRPLAVAASRGKLVEPKSGPANA